MTVVLLAALALAAAEPPVQDTRSANPPSAKPAPPADGATVSGLVVTGTHDQVETSIDRKSYSVAADLSATTGNVGDVLRNIPSVQVDVQGNLSLRGDPNVTVLVDGKPSSQFSSDNLAQALQSTPADRIDRIEVITNPSAEFRADGTGGIINLITKKAKGAGKTASVRIQAINAGRAVVSANAGFNSDKLSVTTDATYRRDRGTLHGLYDQSITVPTVETSQDHVEGLMTSDYGQAHIGADYDFSPKTHLSASLRLMNINSHQATGDDLVFSNGSASFGLDRLHIFQDNGEASLILRHKFQEGEDLSLTATFQDNEAATRRIDTTGPASNAPPTSAQFIGRENFNRHSFVMADYERSLPGMAKLKLGYDFDYNAQLVEHSGGPATAAGAYLLDPSLTRNFADDDNHHQVYATFEQPLGKLDILAGLRAEHVNLALNQVAPTPAAKTPPDQSYTKLYPTLHLGYDLTADQKLTASYSKRVLRPAPADLDPFVFSAGTGSSLGGNPALKPQETNSFELGYEHRKDAGSLIGTLYYRQTENAFSSVFTDLGNGNLLQQRANLGHQQAAGFEWAVSDKLTPKLTYNFSIDGYWAQISTLSQALPQNRSEVTGFGRANLNWQITPKDFLQFNLFANAKSLAPQGYILPTYSGNIGYRHTINSKASWMLVAQDPFHTLKYISVLDSGGVSDHRVQQPSTRSVSLTFVWNFSGKPQNANFDFAPGGGGG